MTPPAQLRRRVLIVAYYFPPIGGIGSIRAASFAALLPAHGWDVRVVAPGATPHRADPSLAFSREDVVRASSLEPALLLRRLRRRTRGGAAAASAPALHTATHARLLELAFPDAQLGWYPAATVAALRLAREQRFDAILSSSYPVTAHLVAWSVSRLTRLPWVAEFRDPWSERFALATERRAAERLELAIVGAARRVIVPSAAFAEHYAERWGVRVDAIPNGHDLPRDPPAPRPCGRKVLAHVGSYYPGRQSLVSVWRALAEMKAAGAAPPRVRWVGELGAQARAELAGSGLLEDLEVTGHLPHAQATELMRSATMLFASGERDTGPLGRGTTAAKLFEYLASGRPILYLCDPGADAAAILGRYDGCHVAAFDDEPAVRRAIEAGLDGRSYERDVERFSRRARAAELAAVLDSVAG